MRIRKFLCGAAVVCVLAGLASAADTDAAIVNSSREWLALIDGSKFSDSWRATSELMRAKVSEDQWMQAMQGVRSTFGAVASRQVPAVTRVKTLPGMPDGDYAIVQYQSVFEKKKSALESVVLQGGKDGWRIVGYNIR